MSSIESDIPDLGLSPEMLSRKHRKETGRKITRCALRRWGELKKRKVRPPLDQCILSMMYRRASVQRATRALQQLQRRFVDWNEVRVSWETEIAACISPADWAVSSAASIKTFLEGLFEQHNVVTLDFLEGMPVPDAHKVLTGLPGTDREFANEILMMSLRVPLLPCPEDTVRICYRLGLLEKEERPGKRLPMPAALSAYPLLSELLEERYYPSLHLFFCDLAKDACLEENPKCDRCLQQKYCYRPPRADAQTA